MRPAGNGFRKQQVTAAVSKTEPFPFCSGVRCTNLQRDDSRCLKEFVTEKSEMAGELCQKKLCLWLAAFGLCISAPLPEQVFSADPAVPLIFDTDIGNDVDDVLALGMIHALETRGRCRLLAVTITKDHPHCAPFVDAVNTFYGRGDIEIGVCVSGITPDAGKFTLLAGQKDDGHQRYPHDLLSGAVAPTAVKVLRKALAAQADKSVVIVQVGFSTNLAQLLDSPADEISPLTGRELAAGKVRLLSVMAGAFQPIEGQTHLEYNVVEDIPSAKKLVAEWPSPIVFSGFEIGLNAAYPAVSIQSDYQYAEHHPLVESYVLYSPPPHNRPTWDLTSVLYALFPDRGYFGVSETGNVEISDTGETRLVKSDEGRHRHLTMSEEQRIRVVEALVQLSSEPPLKKNTADRPRETR